MYISHACAITAMYRDVVVRRRCGEKADNPMRPHQERKFVRCKRTRQSMNALEYEAKRRATPPLVLW